MKTIFTFIKHHFWPHHRNSYHPHALRLPMFLIVVASLLVAQLTMSGFVSNGQVLGVQGSIEATELLNLTNAQRSKAGLTPLTMNQELQAAAQAKADDMITRDYWAHYAPDGTSPWRFIENSGYYYETAGENLAKNFATSSGVMSGWMNSEGHRENVLRPEYKDIGIAVAEGTIDGEKTEVVVAMYARPQPVGVTLLGNKVAKAGEALPAQTAYSLANPLNPGQTLPAITWIFVVASALFAGLYAIQHIIVRNRRLAWDKAAHPHPMVQAFLFGGLTVLLLQSGFGVVG